MSGYFFDASNAGGLRIQPWIFLPSKLVYQISSGSFIVQLAEERVVERRELLRRGRRRRRVEHVQIADGRRRRERRTRSSAPAASAVYDITSCCRS